MGEQEVGELGGQAEGHQLGIRQELEGREESQRFFQDLATKRTRSNHSLQGICGMFFLLAFAKLLKHLMQAYMTSYIITHKTLR